MNGYEQFISLVLASALAIFLILGIVLLILGIKIVKRIKHIADKAEQIADKADAVSSFFKNASGPFIIGKFLANMGKVVSKHGKSKRGK